jgi:hypothetical protein
MGKIVMDIKEYSAQNMGKQVLVLKGDEIKALNHFASIAKAGNLKGLIVAGKYVGFTDTYRLATVKDLHEELQGSDTALMYDVLDELKKAGSLAVLKDGKLAIQIGSEVTEYEPMKDIKVPDIVKVIEDLEYESYTQADPTINFTEDTVWKMLKTINWKDGFKRFFSFDNGKVSVEAYPNDESKLFLEIMELDNKSASLKTSLDFKYVDLWFKWIKGDKFNMAIGKNNRSAIKFSKENTDYIVMPQVLR